MLIPLELGVFNPEEGFLQHIHYTWEYQYIMIEHSGHTEKHRYDMIRSWQIYNSLWRFPARHGDSWRVPQIITNHLLVMDDHFTWYWNGRFHEINHPAIGVFLWVSYGFLMVFLWFGVPLWLWKPQISHGDDRGSPKAFSIPGPTTWQVSAARAAEERSWENLAVFFFDGVQRGPYGVLKDDLSKINHLYVSGYVCIASSHLLELHPN